MNAPRWTFRLLTAALLACAVCTAHAASLGVVAPTLLVAPGATVDVPVDATGSPVGMGITALDFGITLDPTWVQSVTLLPGGMVDTWGTPFSVVGTSSVAIAAAGGTPITSGDTRIATLRITLKPGVPAGTDVWLAFDHFLFNESDAAAVTTDGLLRVRAGTTGTGGTPGAALALAPPSPSPASRGTGGTRLEFALPAASRGRARLAVHDAAGRRVRTLVDAPLAAGRHVVTWDLADASGAAVRAGVYFVRLDCDAGTRWRRITVLD